MEMHAPDKLAQVQAIIATLLPAEVAVAVTDPLAQPDDVFGPEAAHLAKAVPKRRREFAAGRLAARQAMAALGHVYSPVFAGTDRAPIWPAGLHGSISHSDTLCAAAITKAPLSIGLDMEPFTPLSEALLPSICSDAESARIAGPDQARLAKLIFSAKEAAYKAQYPITVEVFGFHHFDVLLDADAQTFKATFTQSVGAFATGKTLHGRFAQALDHIVTAVTIPLEEGAGA